MSFGWTIDGLQPLQAPGLAEIRRLTSIWSNLEQQSAFQIRNTCRAIFQKSASLTFMPNSSSENSSAPPRILIRHKYILRICISSRWACDDPFVLKNTWIALHLAHWLYEEDWQKVDLNVWKTKQEINIIFNSDLQFCNFSRKLQLREKIAKFHDLIWQNY